MDNTNSALLPHILESLSQKPELTDTFENLCGEIKYILSSENLKEQYGNVEKAIENALDVGQSLGVLTLTEDIVRPPFKKSAQKTSALTDESENFGVQPRRTHTVRSNMIPHDRSRRRRSRSRRRRRGSRRRSRSRRR